jgi:glycosyltransferase involved in cell wall biosynthesis
MKLTLAMIARDEEENLAQCLPSIRPYVDELIVVDTGSVDRTKEVARSFGAQVFDFNHRTNPESFFLDDEATCRTFGAPPPYSGDMALGDFGAARAESFKHATGDYILWVDADDVVEGGEHLRMCVTDLAAKNGDMAFLAYDYARDHLGRVFYRQWRERIVKRGSVTWTNPVHEVMMPNRPLSTAKYGDVKISHRRKADRKSIPNRNYKILLRQAAQLADRANIDPRILFYLGQEARFIEPERALAFYHEYLKKSGWAEERAAAHCNIGQLYEFGIGCGNDPPTAYQRAMREYATANTELPENPDGLFGFARIAYLQGRYGDCVRHTERGFAMGNPDSMLGANPMDRVYRPHVYYNHALSFLGRLEDAIESCKAGLAVCPDDPGVPGGSPGMLLHNLKAFTDALAARNAAQPKAPQVGVVNFNKNEDLESPAAIGIPHDAMVIWALQLWKQARGDAARERSLLASLPPSIANDPVVLRMKESTAKRFSPAAAAMAQGVTAEAMQAWAADHRERDSFPWGSFGFTHSVAVKPPAPAAEVVTPPAVSGPVSGALSIVVWIGPAVEPWDPTTPDTKGIGGSETACIEICREMHRRGHKVTVYGCCPDRAGIYDGVDYRHWETLRDGSIECDVFISSRAPSIMEANQRINARLKLLWVHDIHCGPPSPQMERWLLAFDRVLCLSRWHKTFFCSTYPTLDPDRVIVTRNGINPERFEAVDEHCVDDHVGKYNRLIFSSSPNRGLDNLLYLFPFVREKVPDAELHIYYGFDCWEAFARAQNNTAELAVIDEYKRRINAAVREGGVTFHGRVNQLVLAGAFLRSKVWAYPTLFTETNCVTAMEAQAGGCVPVCSNIAALPETVKHGILIDPNDGGDRFVAECVRLLTDEGYRQPIADAGRKHALANLTWRGLAAEWEAMFKRAMEENAVRPLPVYREVV